MIQGGFHRGWAAPIEGHTQIERGEQRLRNNLTELNYFLLSRFLVCHILEMTNVETPDNRAAPVDDVPNSFVIEWSSSVDKIAVSS